MTKRNMTNGKILFLYGVVSLFCILIAAALNVHVEEEKEIEGITYAEMSKLVAFACVEDENAFNQDEEWYKPYMDYVNINDYIHFDNINAYVKYNDIYELCHRLEVDSEYLKNCGFDNINLFKNSEEKVSKKSFLAIYQELLPAFPYGSEVYSINLGIAGTPSNMNDVNEWEAYTTEGCYRYDGLIIQPFIDKTISVLARGRNILCVERIVSNAVAYKNVWIEEAYENTLLANLYGAERKFEINGLTENVVESLADIYVEKGVVKNIDIKKDVITGKVLSATKEFVEIQGYGKVPLDDKFVIYDNVSDVKVRNYEDIVVGYALQDFIVAEGRVCGAVIQEKLDAADIRVILKTDNFAKLFHESVVLSANMDMKMTAGEHETLYKAGEEAVIDRDSGLFQEGRIVFETEGGEITLKSIRRGQGMPAYKGSIELSLYDEGIVVVNDVDIEEYLKRVVPSEMPYSYGVNALKCQAVCARSYAYTQLTNNNYREYGAHVDDSIQYQVYNNTNEHEESNTAIEATRGEVVTYNGEPVKTYYYSTSCGTTTDVCLWGNTHENYPMFTSVSVSANPKTLDLTDETAFETFINSRDEKDYDYGYPLYRWQLRQDIQQISNSFNAKLYGCYCANPQGILKQNSNGEYVSESIYSVGTIQSVEVMKRVCGGAVIQVKVTGSDAIITVSGEATIRTLFGNGEADMQTEAGTARYSALPSTFCNFRPEYTDGILTGYTITGGGYGHGIGMSQNAVKKMAETYDYKDILKFFYKGIEIMNYSSS